MPYEGDASIFHGAFGCRYIRELRDTKESRAAAIPTSLLCYYNI